MVSGPAAARTGYHKAVTPSRREFLSRMAASGLAVRNSTTVAAGPRGRIKAVAFDGFPILDPRPVFALADELFPGKGAELSNAWAYQTV